MKLRHGALAFLSLAASFAACTRVEMADQPPVVSIDGGFAGEPQGGAGSVPGEGGRASGGEGVDAGGVPPSVALGIWPTYAKAAPDGEVGAVIAAITTLSAGALTLPIYETWSELTGATGSPRALTWARLDAMIEPHRERAADVALCVGIVDRQREAWPTTGGLDSDEAARAMERTIDLIYTRYGPELTHLCFGYEVDRYLDVASEDDSERLLDFLAHSVDYASRHPLKAARTAIGTSITLAALAREDALLDRILLGDEAVVVYDALDEEGALKEPEAVADELARALTTLEGRQADEPQSLALFEAGYPSDGATGATERAQQGFFEALFAELDERRGRVSFVGINGLGDRSLADCETEAASFGDAEGVRPLVRCKMGLRAEPASGGAEKPAWDVVSRALSRYR